MGAIVSAISALMLFSFAIRLPTALSGYDPNFYSPSRTTYCNAGKLWRNCLSIVYINLRDHDAHLANSGEVSGLLIRVDEPVQTPVQVRYRHYYVLNALRERMIEALGEGWKSVRASYGPRGGMEFYFDY